MSSGINEVEKYTDGTNHTDNSDLELISDPT